MSYRTKNPLAAVFYELMRDHVPPEVVEKIVEQDSAYVTGTAFLLSNEELGARAHEAAKKVLKRYAPDCE